MMGWSSKHIALIAGLFISFFMGALTITTLCDLEIIDYGSNLSHQHEDIIEANGSKQHHAHGHEKEMAGAQHQSTETDECCDDASSILESSLFTHILKSAVPLAKNFLAGIIEFKLQISDRYQSKHIVYHEYDDPPPLNGFDLRVVIQSFLN